MTFYLPKACTQIDWAQSARLICLRLQTATAEQLNLWTDRILDAPTLAAVFDAH